jgi:hypothetical protein
MASTAQIEANRKNALRSTGPKTEKGKERARLNALKHGFTARTVVPVLPHEDPRALDKRIRRWTEDWQPQNEQEAELVCHGAKLSWQIDRAERFETAHLSHRVRKAQRRAAGAPDPRRLEEVADLGRKLLGRFWDGSRAVLIARLEATAEGCRWLLGQWAELQTLSSSGTTGEVSDLHRFIHLLGKQRFEAVTDPALNALLVAWDVLKPGMAKDLWKWTALEDVPGAASYVRSIGWREFGPRPTNPAEAAAVIAEMRDRQIGHLTRLLAGHEQWIAEEALDLPDRAAFDPGTGFERHRRYRMALGRELLRTLETLRRLRKDGYHLPGVGHDSARVIPAEQTDTMENLSHPGDESDSVGIVSHEADASDTNGVLSQEVTKPEKAPNETKPPSPQCVDGKQVLSQHGPTANAERSHFPERETTAKTGKRRTVSAENLGSPRARFANSEVEANNAGQQVPKDAANLTSSGAQSSIEGWV